MNEKKPKRAKFFSLQCWFYDLVKVTAALPGLLFFRPKILYESKLAKKRIRGGALVISNHTGLIDPVYLQFAIWYRRHRFICMKELANSKGRWFFRHFLCIPIDRENFNTDSFREITGHLQAGHVVSMFPEGHVNNDAHGPLQAFKSGMILMAARSGAPIISVYLRRPAHWYNRLVVAVGEPVAVSAENGILPSFAQVNDLTLQLYEKEARLKDLCEKK